MRLGRGLVGVLFVAASYSAVALLGKDRADVWLTVACAVVLAIAIVLVAQDLLLSGRAQFAVWFGLLFLNLASVAIEGTLFAPAAAPPSDLAWNLLRLAAASSLIGASMAVLFGERGSAAVLLASRPSIAWLWRLGAVAAIYVGLYLILGGLNYTFVTHPYYEAHAGGVTVPAAATVFAYEPVRGVLIALSMIPLTLALRSRHTTARVPLIAGLMLFVVGGFVPLLPQSSLPLDLRIASLWEIFGQNFLTGAAGAYVFGSGVSAPGRFHLAGRSSPTG